MRAESQRVVEGLRVAVVIPVRDDWVSLVALLEQIDAYPYDGDFKLDVLLIDDGSRHPFEYDCRQRHFNAISSLRTLRLRRNLGHQRAIAVGLAYLSENETPDAVLVMDADGEDTAEGAWELITTFGQSERTSAVFAERSRRSESLVFKLFYRLFRVSHYILTGIPVRVGNFSILPFSYLATLSVASEMWNHYAAAVFRSRLAFSTIPIPRGHRIAGQSTMNFVALVTHGLSAISVFGDIVGVRLLIATLAGALGAILGTLVVVAVRLFTPYAIPGWATYTAGILLILVMQLLTVATAFTIFMLFNRASGGFIPARDYRLFVLSLSSLHGPLAGPDMAP